MKKVSLVVVVSLLVNMVVYGSGWVDKGDYIRLNNSEDQVIIGSTKKPGGNQTGVAKLYIVNGSQYLELAKKFENTARLRLRADDTNGGSIAYTWNAPLKFYNGNMIERMRIQGNGNVGIGTTSPAEKLHVAGTAQMNGFKLSTGAVDGYVLTSNSEGEGEWKEIIGGGGSCLWGGDLSKTYYMGKVGIGTSDPIMWESSIMDFGVIGKARITQRLYVEAIQAADGDLTLAGYHPAYPSGVLKIGGTNDCYFYPPATPPPFRNIILCHTGSSARGYVGIRTNTPSEPLDVAGTIKMTGFNMPTGAQNGYVLTSNSEGEGEWKEIVGGGGTSWWTENDGDIHYNNLEGNVGIGTTSPNSKLSVGGNGATNGAIYGGGTSYGILGAGSDAGIKGRGGTAGVIAFGDTYDFYASNTSGKSYFAGKVGIGTKKPQSELTVNGTITAEEIEVQVNVLPDFVFEENYKLMPLNKLEKHIKKEKSLPGIPTNKEAKEKGIKLGDMQAKLLEKVEELTLYVIEQNKKLNNLNNEVNELKKENGALKQQISMLDK